MIYELKCESIFSTSPAYFCQTIFYTTINKYIRILYYFPSEGTRLKTSIIFVAGILDTRAPFIVLKMRTRLWSCDTNLLAYNVQTMQREHFAIYVSLDEINFQHPPLISGPSPMVL